MNRPMGGRRSEGGVQWVRALALIGVLVLVGVLILSKTGGKSSPSGANHPNSHHPTTVSTSSTLPAPVTTTTLLPANQVKVQVLNGLRTGALAGAWTRKLKTQFGYITELPDDATVKTTTSVIYVLTLGYQAEADQLAVQVGLTPSAVFPTVPAPASAPIPANERTTANLVLVIGQDLAGTA